MESEIATTIERLDRRIKKLTAIRDGLQEEYGERAPMSTGSFAASAPVRSRSGTRKEQLIAFLDQHGPMRAKDIMNEMGIPRGSVSWTLRRPEFTRLSDGRWDIVRGRNGR